MERRGFVTAAAALAASAVPIARAAGGAARSDNAELDAALAKLRAIPGTVGYLIEIGAPGTHRIGHAADTSMFVGSALKTFILARYLRDVEDGRLSEDEQLPIDDAVRSPSSPVFLHLTGTTPARSVLEAMITHSDNTATDAALLRVGVGRVRALIASAGLQATRLCDSTRRMVSYLAGAPPGTDIGWSGVEKMMAGKQPGPSRPAINDTETMMSSAADMVSWYQRALRGAFFAKPATLVEFKRIQAMADAIPVAVPPDTPAWGKGGSIDWNGFHCLAFAGQMLVGQIPVTFCFTVNWNGPDDGVHAVFAAYKDAVRDSLAAVARRA